jgi:hypothetical protein
MPSVGRFADAAKQALANNSRALENRSLGTFAMVWTMTW